MGNGATGARIGGGLNNEAAQFVGARIEELGGANRAERAEIFDRVASAGEGTGSNLTTAAIDTIIRQVIPG